MLKVIALSMALLTSHLFTAATMASSPQAWEKSHQEMINKCIKASGLKATKPVSKPILFDDTVGYTGLILKGQYSQTHMKNEEGQVLCLFNRKTRKVYVEAIS
jgi:hypothetical protein